MEVIYYQLFIIFTLVVVRIVKEEFLVWGCVIWSVLTIANLFYWPLIFIQLGVVWATYHFLKEKDETVEGLTGAGFENSDIVELRRTVDQLSESQAAYSRQIDSKSRRPLKTEDHWKFLLSSVQSAQKELIIISGWLDDRVVGDLGFHRALRTVLGRGVDVYFGFGWKGHDGSHKVGPGFERGLKTLQGLSNTFPGQLQVADFSNHSKMIIVDQQRIAIGSANWLSNKQYRNEEDTVVMDDAELASRYAVQMKQRIADARSVLVPQGQPANAQRGAK